MAEEITLNVFPVAPYRQLPLNGSVVIRIRFRLFFRECVGKCSTAALKSRSTNVVAQR